VSDKDIDTETSMEILTMSPFGNYEKNVICVKRQAEVDCLADLVACVVRTHCIDVVFGRFRPTGE
jgi:hypothetical protein